MLFLLISSVLILIAFLIILPPLWKISPNPSFSKRGENEPPHPLAKKGKNKLPSTLAKGGKNDLPPPLAKGGGGGFADLDQRNIAIARQRLTELKEQLQAGGLTQTLYDEQLIELEQALSDDLDIKSHEQAPSSQGRWMAWVLVLAVPLLSASLYWTLGNYQSLTPGDQTVASTPEREQMISMVAGLAQRLEKQPADAQGWLMLGRSYKYLEDFPKASVAFEHAYKLMGDKPEIMLLYADALAFVNNEELAGKPAELVFKALAIEPENITGLWLGGMAKAQIGEFVAAMALWKKLEPLLPPGSEGLQEIQSMMAKLATEIPEATEPAEVAATPALTAANIAVEVSLPPDVQHSTSPTDTIFVYAQALSGPQMPLAIVRKQVSDLPLSVNLTDAMAMMPTMKLSNFAQVKLLARISKSGNAMKQPGDLIGVIESVTLIDPSTHKIVINDQVK
jgi:cytochrome c-type biogenesis protein CcmH